MTNTAKGHGRFLRTNLLLGADFTKLFTACLLAVLLAGCAQPTPYKPACEEGTGYTDQRIEHDRWRVTFKGNYLTDRETVENYLLYRAAEVTIQQGKDFFIIVDKDVEAVRQTRGYGRPAYGFAYHHGFHHPHHFFGLHHSYYGYPYFGSDFHTREYHRYNAFAEIVLRSGTPPEDAPEAYDAPAVVDALRPVIEPLRQKANKQS